MTTTLDRPVVHEQDRGLDDDRVHLRRRDCPEVAVCGADAHPHGCPDVTFRVGMTACPSCGRPACRACIDIIHSYERMGGWEGE